MLSIVVTRQSAFTQSSPNRARFEGSAARVPARYWRLLEAAEIRTDDSFWVGTGCVTETRTEPKRATSKGSWRAKHPGRRSAYRSPKHSLVGSAFWKVTPPSALEKLARTGFNYLHKDDTGFRGNEGLHRIYCVSHRLLSANSLRRDPPFLATFSNFARNVRTPGGLGR
jgi:hypothetical protein